MIIINTSRHRPWPTPWALSCHIRLVSLSWLLPLTLLPLFWSLFITGHSCSIITITPIPCTISPYSIWVMVRLFYDFHRPILVYLTISWNYGITISSGHLYYNSSVRISTKKHLRRLIYNLGTPICVFLLLLYHPLVLDFIPHVITCVYSLLTSILCALCYCGAPALRITCQLSHLLVLSWS